MKGINEIMLVKVIKKKKTWKAVCSYWDYDDKHSESKAFLFFLVEFSFYSGRVHFSLHMQNLSYSHKSKDDFFIWGEIYTVHRAILVPQLNLEKLINTLLAGPKRMSSKRNKINFFCF